MADRQIRKVLFTSPQTLELKKSRRTILGPKEELRSLPQRPSPSSGTKRKRSTIALESIALKNICDASPVPLPIAAAAAAVSVSTDSDKILSSESDPKTVALNMRSSKGKLTEGLTQGIGISQEQLSTPTQRKRVTFADAVVIREGYPEFSRQTLDKRGADLRTNYRKERTRESSSETATNGSGPNKMEGNASSLARHASPVSPTLDNARLPSAPHSLLREGTDSLQQSCNDSSVLITGIRSSGRLLSFQGDCSLIQSTKEQEMEQGFGKTSQADSDKKYTGAGPESPTLPGDHSPVYLEAEVIDSADKAPKQRASEFGSCDAESRLRKRSIEKTDSEDCHDGRAQRKKRPRLSEVLRLQKSLETAFWTDSRKVRKLREPIEISDDDDKQLSSRETRSRNEVNKKFPVRRPNTRRDLQTRPTSTKRKKKSSIFKHAASPNIATRDSMANDSCGPLTRSRVHNTNQNPSVVGSGKDRRQQSSQRTVGNKPKRSSGTHCRNKHLPRSPGKRNETVRPRSVSPVSSDISQAVVLSTEAVILQDTASQGETKAVVIRNRSKRKSSSPRQFRNTCLAHVRQLPYEKEATSIENRSTSPRLFRMAAKGDGVEVPYTAESCSQDNYKKGTLGTTARGTDEKADGNPAMDSDLEFVDFVEFSAKDWVNLQIGWDLHMEIVSTGTQIDLSKIFEYIQSPFGFGNSVVFFL